MSRQSGGFNNFGYPMKQSSVNMNGDRNIGMPLEPNLVSITPKQQNKDMVGQVEFEFSLSPGSEFIPAKSYFLMNLQLVVSDATSVTRAPTRGDNICLSNLVGGQIFQDVYFDLANRNISKQTTQQAQAYALYNRMSYGGGFLENNKDIFYYYPDINDRIDDMCVGGNNSNYLCINTPDAVVVIDGTNPFLLTVAGANFFDPTIGLKNGDTILYNKLGSGYSKHTVINVIDDEQIQIFPALTVTNPGVDDSVSQKKFTVIRKQLSDSYQSSGKKLIAYQPPMGVFQLTSGITCSNVRFSLNPSPNWYNRSVQQLYPRLPEDISGLIPLMTNTTRSYSQTPGALNSYTITVENIQFYAYVQNRITPLPRELTLKTLDTQIFRRTVTTQNNIVEQFSIPASTKFIVIFLQDTNAADPSQNIYYGNVNCGNYLTASDFRTWDNSSASLKTLSIQIGSLKFPKNDQIQIGTKVPNDAGSQTIELIDNMIERYMDTQVVTSKFFSDAGSESYAKWRTSPYYAFNVAQSKDSWSTVLQVQGTFNQDVTSASVKAGGNISQGFNLFVVSFYEKIAQIITENGLVTSVATSEI